MKKWFSLAVLLLGLACQPVFGVSANYQRTSTGEIIFVEPTSSDADQTSPAPSNHQPSQLATTSQAPPFKQGLIPRLGARPEILYGLIGSLLTCTMLLLFVIRRYKEDKEEGK
ncbi:hypothetical protein BVJ53_06825 [Lacticaseibacillus chiayiensis]|uniref:Cell wall protein n=1 Tax=Lacticaseibacillus chiayiensis TaxID=2100821 RepID=A0A4Q1U2L7_9LACO|nr:hypothetical protein [Lacticaseibacillus chiayiensis]QVI34900.1 hypothetical protein KG086_00690 [Lacticaseibacillus chiayiensis]RXT24955.1 hypothetical protein BVJ53_06825 [Lacticaseibacillus chiayiensis]RXT58936.1 hypothetical protein CHT97_03690 [Lacticaseibacillus chiayiensis]UYN56658.1 hypothetical protein OFW50_00695 [Lacticaseibacillus chiayiensis]